MPIVALFAQAASEAQRSGAGGNALALAARAWRALAPADRVVYEEGATREREAYEAACDAADEGALRRRGTAGWGVAISY